VRDPNDFITCATVEGQLVRYVKGDLAREEAEVIERHLRACPICPRELEEVKQMTTLLNEYEESFCPEIQEIFDFVNHGLDPEGIISRHLERCARCSESAEACKFLPQEVKMPENLWNRIEQQLPQRPAVQPSHEPEGWFSQLFGWLPSLPRLPVMAMATAAAVGVLIMVHPTILYPEPTMIGLSSVTWGDARDEMVFKSGRAAADRERLAHIVTFKGFKEPWPQKRIDQLYRALKPSNEMRSRLDFVTPAQVEAALKGKREYGKTSDMLADLRAKLAVTKLVVSTVSSDGAKLSVTSELVETKTGKILNRSVKTETPDAELPSRLREAAYSALAEGK